MKNWKTTVPGLFAIAIQAAHFYPPAIPFIGPITALLTAVGLYSAQDAGK